MTQDKKTLKTCVEQRKRFVRWLMKEAMINVLAEQGEEVASQAPAPAPESAPTPAPPSAYSVDDLIQELNEIRSGKSFSDPEVYGRLTTFFNGLDDQQKSALDDLLNQIAELSTGPVNQSMPPSQRTNQASQLPPPPGAPSPSSPAPTAATGPAVGL
jgi:hypothetical protein